MDDLAPVRVRPADGSWQEVHAVERPDEFDPQWQSWDMAFEDPAHVVQTGDN